MVSRSSFNMDHVRSKFRLQVLKIEKNVNTIVVAVSIQIFWKLVRKVVLMISRSSFNISHIGSKTKSHSLNIEKTCEHSSDQISRKYIRKVVLIISRSSSIIGHLG
jgi:hypothetical protein